jgi:nitroreductase
MTTNHEPSLLYEVMRNARAIRRYRRDPVPDDVLYRIIRAATFAASGGNRQPWRFLVVQGEEEKRWLRDHYLVLWRDYVAMRMARGSTALATRAEQEIADRFAEEFHLAPLIIVVCVRIVDLSITDADLGRPSVVGGASIYPAVENLLLACRAEGLGAVLTTLLCRVEPALRQRFGIDDGWATCAHVPIGYPAEPPRGTVRRRAPHEVSFLDRWGVPLPAPPG